MGDIYVPRRYRVRFNADFKPECPAEVEVRLIPTGVFGIQDGRTPRRAEAASVSFDQKTGEFVVHGPTGEPITLDPISIKGFSIGIDQPVNLVGNRLTWTQAGTSTADPKEATEMIER